MWHHTKCILTLALCKSQWVFSLSSIQFAEIPKSLQKANVIAKHPDRESLKKRQHGERKGIGEKTNYVKINPALVKSIIWIADISDTM